LKLLLNWLKAVIIFIIVASFAGIFLTGGNAQSAFEQLFAMGFVFILVVTFVPQFIVDEKDRKKSKKTDD
jgi:uncharacterized membrane protein YfcA